MSPSLSGFFPRPFRCLIASCPRRRAPAAAGELLFVIASLLLLGLGRLVSDDLQTSQTWGRGWQKRRGRSSAGEGRRPGDDELHGRRRSDDAGALQAAAGLAEGSGGFAKERRTSQRRYGRGGGSGRADGERRRIAGSVEDTLEVDGEGPGSD